MMDRHEDTAAREWVMRQLRDGTPVSELHEMVDQVAEGVLANAIEAERRQRHRADALEHERDLIRAESDRLRKGISALASDDHEPSC